jgi:hypothetical protein
MIQTTKNIVLINLVLILFSCDKENTNMSLDLELESHFTGTFETLNSDDTTGTVVLNISNGTYSSTTNLPYGQGAGLLTADERTINFQDTLFFPVPAIYGPSYVLSGEHEYAFDGKTLTLWKRGNKAEIKYQLQKIN